MTSLGTLQIVSGSPSPSVTQKSTILFCMSTWFVFYFDALSALGFYKDRGVSTTGEL